MRPLTQPWLDMKASCCLSCSYSVASDKCLIIFVILSDHCNTNFGDRYTIQTDADQSQQGSDSLPQTVRPAPSLRPTVRPSPLPSVTLQPTRESCAGATWRYDTNHARGCTNHERVTTAPTWLFSSWEECCQRFFASGQGCRVDDRCQTSVKFLSQDDAPQAGHQNCDSHPQYHPDVIRKDGCTNSRDVPSAWQDFTDELFFPTAEACCQELYFDLGHDCMVRDVCSVATTAFPLCASTRWHSSREGCSNGPAKGNVKLFSDFAACCLARSPSDFLSCRRYEECVDPAAPAEASGTQLSACAAAKWHPSQDFSR